MAWVKWSDTANSHRCFMKLAEVAADSGDPRLESETKGAVFALAQWSAQTWSDYVVPWGAAITILGMGRARALVDVMLDVGLLTDCSTEEEKVYKLIDDEQGLFHIIKRSDKMMAAKRKRDRNRGSLVVPVLLRDGAACRYTGEPVNFKSTNSDDGGTFDHRAPETAAFVEKVMRHWLDRGVDGWRLDAAYAVDPDFWSGVLANVRADFPHAFIYGEVIHGDYVDIVGRSTMDSVTEYELWKAIWSSLKEQNFYELEWTLGRHDTFLESFVPVTFVGNHDVTRIASQVGQDKAVLALVVLMTVGGVPLIYYGDEQGYAGVKEERFGGDDQVRPVFPDDPEELSTLGAWVHNAHHQLIALRRRHPWLHRARVKVTSIANERLIYEATGDGHSLTVELEVTGKPSAEIRGGENVEFRYPRP